MTIRDLHSITNERTNKCTNKCTNERTNVRYAGGKWAYFSPHPLLVGYETHNFREVIIKSKPMFVATFHKKIKIKVKIKSIELVWIFYSLSRWGLPESLDDRICPPIMLTIESRMINRLEHVVQSFFHTWFLVSVLGFTPNHTPLKYRWQLIWDRKSNLAHLP